MVLSKFSLFRDLNDQELAKIVDIAIARDWKKNTHAFLQGDPLTNVYFIFEGKVKIYKSDSSGREQGEYPAFAEIIENSKLVVVPIDQFEKVLIENPHLCIKVFKVLGEKIIDLQDRLEEQILNNTYEQIIKLLVRLAEKNGTTFEDGRILLKSEFTNKDLANMIGTTRETVSRTLTKMKKEELIEVNANGDMILDPQVLLDEIF
ncbi:MAG: Crp/Fnr family transcriptional regulator [Bacillus sp. (in: firmicutes)]|nr:Crp/Fnr family transcriptional regulator [Bacillus sp. (in: firmicutes)]